MIEHPEPGRSAPRLTPVKIPGSGHDIRRERVDAFLAARRALRLG